MKIGVYGSAGGDIENGMEKARMIGEEIAEGGHTLVFGACPGLPYEAAKAAHECGGKVEGYSPGLDWGDHVDRFRFPRLEFAVMHYVPYTFEYKDKKHMCLKYRNLRSVDTSDAAILVGGRIGTLNEFTLSYDFGKIIGVLEKSGGIGGEIKKIVELAKKKSGAVMIYEEDPQKLVLEVIDEFEKK